MQASNTIFMKQSNTPFIIAVIIAILAIAAAVYFALRPVAVEFTTTEVIEETNVEATTEDPRDVTPEWTIEDSVKLLLLAPHTPDTLSNRLGWKTNYLENVGVYFDAPQELSFEATDITTAIIFDEPMTDHALITIKDPNDPDYGLLLAGVVPVGKFPGRGGYWGDVANSLDGEVTCETILGAPKYQEATLSCNSFENGHGLTVNHLQMHPETWGDEEALANVYVIEHPDPGVRAVVFSDERFLPISESRDALERFADYDIDTIPMARAFVYTLVTTVNLVEIE